MPLARLAALAGLLPGLRLARSLAGKLLHLPLHFLGLAAQHLLLPALLRNLLVLALLLGQPWDDELEPFRRAGDGAPVRWLNATG